MSFNYLGSPLVQYFDTNTQEFLDGGLLYSYIASSSTPNATYPTIADASTATNANPWPVVMNSRGEASVVLAGATDLVLKDSLGNEIWSSLGINSSSTNILDQNGNELIAFTPISSAVNSINISNSITGNSPIISTEGTDTNIGLKITTLGSGTLYIDGGSTGTINLGTYSTGGINLEQATAISSSLSVTTNVTVGGNITITGALSAAAASPISFLPAGCIISYGGSTVPTGWLEMTGAPVSRTTYAALFTALGVTYGAGNGSTTFNLPNQSRSVLVGRGGSGTTTLGNALGNTGGEEGHILITAEMPAHTHSYNSTGAFGTQTGSTQLLDSGPSGGTTGSTGGGLVHNNIQPSLVIMYIIRAY